MDDEAKRTGIVTHRLKPDDTEKIKEVATRIYHGSEEAIEFADKPADNPLSLSEDEVPDCWHCGERPKACRCDGGVGP